MTDDDYKSYIDAFNRNDFDHFGKFYSPTVEFRLGDKKRIVGGPAIVEFYRDVKSKVRETLDILAIAHGPGTLAAHVATEFVGLADWPDFVAGPLMTGDVLRIESVCFYYLDAEGRFDRIIGARYRTLETIRAAA